MNFKARRVVRRNHKRRAFVFLTARRAFRLATRLAIASSLLAPCFAQKIQRVNLNSLQSSQSASQKSSASSRQSLEYLWCEAENMRGFSTDRLNNPINNASWIDPPRARAPGWGMNGPGVSAEWSQGGESEWNSAAASADETHATISQELQI